jgi:hypothetical protein
MSSEWMKVMLEEIARKKAKAEQQRLEEDQKADVERGLPHSKAPAPATDPE